MVRQIRTALLTTQTNSSDVGSRPPIDPLRRKPLPAVTIRVPIRHGQYNVICTPGKAIYLGLTSLISPLKPVISLKHSIITLRAFSLCIFGILTES